LVVYVLLIGGEKSSQKRDIKRAIRMARDLEESAMRKTKSKKRVMRLAPFDASEYLDNEEVIAEYLAAALEDPNPDVFLRAVANVAKARGIAAVAEASGLGRESLYKALAPGAKVRYETVRKVLDSLGVKLTVA
jgi:probable addiction module antidote protein